jgi:hypothetical protein
MFCQYSIAVKIPPKTVRRERFARRGSNEMMYEKAIHEILWIPRITSE